jgi:hypothetical protein
LTPRAHNPKVAGSESRPASQKGGSAVARPMPRAQPATMGPVRRTSPLLLSPRSTTEGSRRYARGHLRSSERSPKLWPGRCESHMAQVGAREPQRCPHHTELHEALGAAVAAFPQRAQGPAQGHRTVDLLQDRRRSTVPTTARSPANKRLLDRGVSSRRARLSVHCPTTQTLTRLHE